MTQTQKELAKMWCSLNRWDNVKIGNYTFGGKEDIRTVMAIMKIIEKSIGLDKCLEEWNKKTKL